MREFDFEEIRMVELFAQRCFGVYAELDFAASNDIWLIVQHSCFQEDSKYYLGNEKSMIVELKKAIMRMAATEE